MKLKILIAAELVFVSVSCIPEHHVLDFSLHNDSQIDVSIFIPNKIYGYCMGGLIFESKDLKEVSPMDTSIVGYNNVSWPFFVPSGAVCSGYSSYGLFDIFKLDTLRIFVCEGHEYDLSKVKSYLMRYDITMKDYFNMLNGKRELEIHYPPDVRMKDIKMWPRYEDVISRE